MLIINIKLEFIIFMNIHMPNIFYLLFGILRYTIDATKSLYIILVTQARRERKNDLREEVI